MVVNSLSGTDTYVSSACPSVDLGNYTVTYTYDSLAGGNAGVGRRTGMSDSTGSTAWVYDARGRVLQESKTVTDGVNTLGTYVTAWTYNSADRAVTMTYPNGEEVTYAYLPPGAGAVADVFTTTRPTCPARRWIPPGGCGP
jgi:YD repeat-containing protein